MVHLTRNEHRYSVVIIKLYFCNFQGLGNVVKITRMKQEKRYLMMAGVDIYFHT